MKLRLLLRQKSPQKEVKRVQSSFSECSSLMGEVSIGAVVTHSMGVVYSPFIVAFAITFPTSELHSILMRRTSLRKQGTSETALLKREIQRLLREIVIARDGGCILRDLRHCGGTPEEAVMQADHLISRSNSATYADSRLVVCVCKPCHYWKSVAGNLRKAEYDALIKTLLSKERVELWEQCERDSWKPRKMDWKLEILALEQELKKNMKQSFFYVPRNSRHGFSLNSEFLCPEMNYSMINSILFPKRRC